MGRLLIDGIYEHLVTGELAEALGATSAQAVEAILDDADAHVVLASHVGDELIRALATLPQKGRSERAVKALTVRVILSVTLFALLMLAFRFGFITTKL